MCRRSGSAGTEQMDPKVMAPFQPRPKLEYSPPERDDAGIEACGSAHHWSRELQALGHTVRLMPSACVKRHKNDPLMPEAICEAVTRANMRFVVTKTPEQHSCLTPLSPSRVQERAATLPSATFDRCFSRGSGRSIRQHHEPITEVLMDVSAHERIHLVASRGDTRDVLPR